MQPPPKGHKYEFSTLIEDLRMVAAGDPKLGTETMKFLTIRVEGAVPEAALISPMASLVGS